MYRGTHGVGPEKARQLEQQLFRPTHHGNIMVVRPGVRQRSEGVARQCFNYRPSVTIGFWSTSKKNFVPFALAITSGGELLPLRELRSRDTGLNKCMSAFGGCRAVLYVP